VSSAPTRASSAARSADPVTASSTYCFVAASVLAVGAGTLTCPVNVGDAVGAFAASAVARPVTWDCAIVTGSAPAAPCDAACAPTAPEGRTNATHAVLPALR
jgi:hypothetical protein